LFDDANEPEPLVCYGLTAKIGLRILFADGLHAGDISMVRVELTTEEAEKLHEILDNYLSDLRMEIVDTESHDFRAMLKKRKVFIQRLLEQLEPQAG
jgi:hypothetical protein